MYDVGPRLGVAVRHLKKKPIIAKKISVNSRHQR